MEAPQARLPTNTFESIKQDLDLARIQMKNRFKDKITDLEHSRDAFEDLGSLLKFQWFNRHFSK